MFSSLKILCHPQACMKERERELSVMLTMGEAAHTGHTDEHTDHTRPSPLLLDHYSLWSSSDPDVLPNRRQSHWDCGWLQKAGVQEWYPAFSLFSFDALPPNGPWSILQLAAMDKQRQSLLGGRTYCVLGGRVAGLMLVATGPLQPRSSSALPCFTLYTNIPKNS